MKPSRTRKKELPTLREARRSTAESSFHEVLELIKLARLRAYGIVNSELVSLYWQVGGYILGKFENADWEKASSRSYPDLFNGITRICGVLPAPTLLECGNFSKPTGTTEKSCHWCDNCPEPCVIAFARRRISYTTAG